jgi:hypothetical protein
MREHSPFGDGNPNPDYAAAVKTLMDRAERDEIASCQRVLDHSWLLCSCEPYFNRDDPGRPPQAACPVHGSVLVMLYGRR